MDEELENQKKEAKLKKKIRNATMHLHKAIHEEDMEIVKLAIQEGAIINQIFTKSKQSPLMTACLKGNLEIVKYLFENGADPKIGESDGYLPMDGVSFQGRVDVAKYLIEEQKLDFDYLHTDGYAPIHRACWGKEQRHTDVLKVLLDAGVSPERKSAVLKDGKVLTPLDITTNEASIKLLKSRIQALQKEL